MKDKHVMPSGVRDLCRKLKGQLDELSVELTEKPGVSEEESRRRKVLLERLRTQLLDLSN